MITNHMKTKDFVNILIEDYNKEPAEVVAQQKTVNEANEAIMFQNESILGLSAQRQRNQNKYNTFIESARSMFLTECIYKVYREGMTSDTVIVPLITPIMRSLVSNFVQENGAIEIMHNMRTKSILLSEMANLVDRYMSRVCEEVNMDDSSTLSVSIQAKDDFFEDLDKMEIEDVTDAIASRVADSVGEFLNDNMQDKENIKNILTAAKDKADHIIDSNDIDEKEKAEVIESYDIQAKRKITNIRSKSKGIYATMINEMAKSTMKDDQLKQEFTNEGKLFIERIVDRVTLMYGFLETVNTMKLIKIDEAYLDEVISSFSL